MNIACNVVAVSVTFLSRTPACSLRAVIIHVGSADATRSRLVQVESMDAIIEEELVRDGESDNIQSIDVVAFNKL